MTKYEITLQDVIKLTDSTKVKARTDLADIYLREAGRLAVNAYEILEKSLEITDKKELGKLSSEEIKDSIVSILLSVFALEAYINKIGHDKLDKEIWKSTERNSLKSKWLTYPLIIAGKTFDTEKQPFKKFKEMIQWRNKFAHYTMYDYEVLVNHPSGIKAQSIYKYANAKNAQISFIFATNMIQELDKMLKRKK